MYYYNPRVNTYPTHIVAFATGDVTGDKIPDRVYLTGTKTPDSPFTQKITLVIQDGRTGVITSVPLRENMGYDPTLFLGDFTGDGVSDILISIFSGGSGGMMYHYVISFVGNNAKFLFDSDVYNQQYQYEVTYQDNYKVLVVSKINNQRYIIDLSLRDKEYLSEIYDENGKLKSPITGFVNPISSLYPVDFNYNNVIDLVAYQKIAGRYNADTIGYVMNTLEWKDTKFELQIQLVGIPGF